MKRRIYIIIFLILLSVFGLSANDKLIHQRFSINKLEIKGNKYFRDGSLKQLMVSRPGWLWHRRYYRSELLQEDMVNLQRFYRQNGFLDFEIPYFHVNVDSSRKKASILIRVIEGDRTYIEGIYFFGNEAFSDSLLETMLKVTIGRPMIARDIDQSQNTLLQYYAEHGYLDAQVAIEVKTNPESHRAILNFSITEQQISHLHEIRLTGNQRTIGRIIAGIKNRFRNGHPVFEVIGKPKTSIFNRVVSVRLCSSGIDRQSATRNSRSDYRGAGKSIRRV